MEGKPLGGVEVLKNQEYVGFTFPANVRNYAPPVPPPILSGDCWPRSDLLGVEQSHSVCLIAEFGLLEKESPEIRVQHRGFGKPPAITVFTLPALSRTGWQSHQLFRLSVRIASSRPSRVSGYMRPCISWRTICVDWL